MVKYHAFRFSVALIVFITLSAGCRNTRMSFFSPVHQVTLSEAHVGDLETDTRLLDSYGVLPNNERQFYLSARSVFSENDQADFTDAEIIDLARKNRIPLKGGPMLGNLSGNSIKIWLRPSTTNHLVVKVKSADKGFKKSYNFQPSIPGMAHTLSLDGLLPGRQYAYTIRMKGRRIADGRFTTPPAEQDLSVIRIAFGSCFHKIGLHNPNLIHQIMRREPIAMMLIGDIAVDDRENRINMHRADYLLRDISKPWRMLSANVPLYSSWDDHDYLNNDLSGIPKGFTEADRSALRDVWHQNWNNPEYKDRKSVV